MHTEIINSIIKTYSSLFAMSSFINTIILSSGIPWLRNIW